MTRALAVSLLVLGCSASHTTTDEGDITACDRYLAIASVYACIDPGVWTGGMCPTDAQLAARADGFSTLDTCIALDRGARTACAPEPHP